MYIFYPLTFLKKGKKVTILCHKTTLKSISETEITEFYMFLKLKIMNFGTLKVVNLLNSFF